MQNGVNQVKTSRVCAEKSAELKDPPDACQRIVAEGKNSFHPFLLFATFFGWMYRLAGSEDGRLDSTFAQIGNGSLQLNSHTAEERRVFGDDNAWVDGASVGHFQPGCMQSNRGDQQKA